MNIETAKNALNQEFLIVSNPTLENVSLLGQHIRFTADNRTRTVYAWPFISGHHADVSIGLKLKDSYSCPDVFRGAALMENGTYRFVASDFLSSFKKYPGGDDREFLVEMISIDWSWADQYIMVSTFISDLRRRFGFREEVYSYE